MSHYWRLIKLYVGSRAVWRRWYVCPTVSGHTHSVFEHAPYFLCVCVSLCVTFAHHVIPLEFDSSVWICCQLVRPPAMPILTCSFCELLQVLRGTTETETERNVLERSHKQIQVFYRCLYILCLHLPHISTAHFQPPPSLILHTHRNHPLFPQLHCCPTLDSVSPKNPCRSLAISVFVPWGGHCSVRRTVTSRLSCVTTSFVSSSLPRFAFFIPNRGRFGANINGMLLLRANSCALALLPLSGLSGVYLVCVPGAQRESAHPGEHSQTHSSHPPPLPPTPPPTTTQTSTPPFLTQHSCSLCVWMRGKHSGLVTHCIRRWGERVTGESMRGEAWEGGRVGWRLSVCGGAQWK